jgi:hypothetical protein
MGTANTIRNYIFVSNVGGFQNQTEVLKNT